MFGVTTEPQFLALQQVAPKNGIRVDNIPPRFGNPRGPGDAVKGKKTEYVRNEFRREESEEVASKNRR